MDGVPNVGAPERVRRILAVEISRAKQLAIYHGGITGRADDAAEDTEVARILTGLLAHHTADHAMTAGGTTP